MELLRANPPTLRGPAFRLFSSEIPPPLPPSQWTLGIRVEPRAEPAGAARGFPGHPADAPVLSFARFLGAPKGTTKKQKSVNFRTLKKLPKWKNKSTLGEKL